MRFILILMLAFLTGCEAQAKPRKRANPPLPPKNTPAPIPKKDTVEVLDFYTNWCGPCRKNAPAIDRIEREGTKVTRIDAELDTAMAAQWRIVKYPTYIIVVNGKETFRTSDPAELRLRLHGKKLPRL